VLYETSATKIWEILEKKYLTKSIESRLHLKRRLYCFQLKRGLSIGEHMSYYTKLLADLINVDVEIEEEDKAVILRNSLPDEEYGTFILIFFNSKQTLNYNDVSVAFVNYKVKKKNKQSSSKSDLAEALTVRRRSSSKKGKSDHRRSKRSKEEPVRLL